MIPVNHRVRWFVGVVLVLLSAALITYLIWPSDDARYTEARVTELHAVLDQQPVILDVRPEDAFASWRIEGSVNIPLDRLETAQTILDPTQPVWVLCRQGRISHDAAQQLLALGFQDVRHVGGGLLSWHARGFPVFGEPGDPSDTPDDTPADSEYVAPS